MQNQGKITENKIQNNRTYILEDPQLFSITAYRIMQNDPHSLFVKCFQLRKNGKIKLLYFTSDYKTLSFALPKLDEDAVIKVAANIFLRLAEFTDYGFLSSQNLKVDFEKIYVDIKTLEVYFIYLPINTSSGAAEASVEYEIKAELLYFLKNAYPEPGTPEKIRKLREILMDAALTVKEIEKEINKSKSEINFGYAEKSQAQKLYLTDKNGKRIMSVERQGKILGRQSPDKEGVIANDKTIGRQHCKIIYESSGYCVKDLNSVNRTYLNGKAIPPMEPIPLSDGDHLRIGGSNFFVQIENGEKV